MTVDTRNPTERAFDHGITSQLDEHGPMIALASPDGMNPGTGRWRIEHICPDKRTRWISGTEHRCDGCGQTFAYTATSTPR